VLHVVSSARILNQFLRRISLLMIIVHREILWEKFDHEGNTDMFQSIEFLQLDHPVTQLNLNVNVYVNVQTAIV